MKTITDSRLFSLFATAHSLGYNYDSPKDGKGIMINNQYFDTAIDALTYLHGTEYIEKWSGYQLVERFR